MADLANNYNYTYMDLEFSTNNELANLLFEKVDKLFQKVVRGAFENLNAYSLGLEILKEYLDTDIAIEYQDEGIKPSPDKLYDDLFASFKDIIIDSTGVRALTDRGYTWGITFNYTYGSGVLNIDDRDGTLNVDLILSKDLSEVLEGIKGVYETVGYPLFLASEDGMASLEKFKK